MTGPETAPRENSKRILWVDNDPQYLRPYFEALTQKGFCVIKAVSATEAEQLISSSKFDLLIIDIMLSTSEDEEDKYPPEETDLGLKTGLLLYRRMKDELLKNKIPFLIFTVRLDTNIQDEFLNAGVPRSSISTKYELRKVHDLVSKVESLIDSNSSAG